MTADDSSGGSALLRRIITYAPASIIPSAVTLLTSAIFTRIFDTNEFGWYSLALVVANTLKTAFTVWLTQSIAKFLPPELEQEGNECVKRTIYLSAAIMLGLEVVVGTVALAVAHVLLSADTRQFIVPVIFFVISSSVFDVLCAVYPAEGRAREYVRYQVLASVGTLAARLLMVSALIGMGITLMFWSVVLTQIVLLPVMWSRAGLLSPRHIRGVVLSAESWQLVRSFVAFGIPMTLWLIATLLLDVADRFVIEYFDGAADVGVYDANYRLVVGVVALMIVPVTITLHPYLMRLSGLGVPEVIGKVIGIIVENLLLLGALSVGLVFLYHNEIALLLGPAFREGSVIMPVVLAGVFAFNIGTFAHKPFEIVGRTRPMVVLAYVAAALNVLLNLVLVPMLGYPGAAWATLVAYVVYTVFIAGLGRRIFGWRIHRRIYPQIGLVVLGVAAIGLIRTAVAGTPLVLDLATSGVAAAMLTVWVLWRVQAGVSSVPRIDDGEGR